VRGADRAAAVVRLRALAQAYIGFARSDPNLFRHAFGPHCGHDGESRSYALLDAALDDLDALGLLRPGARAGLDLALWSLVHGFAELALNGNVPWDAADPMLASFERSAFTEAALRVA
jgi:Tetracyclin repressor-like, C-terminal domain